MTSASAPPQSNTLNMFSGSDLRSFPQLLNLRAGHNKFVCSCEFVFFLQALVEAGAAGAAAPGGGGEGVRLVDGPGSYVCDSPLRLQGAVVAGVRLGAADCEQQLVVSLSCGAALLVMLMLGLLLWRLHFLWYLKMTWAWVKAKRSAQRRRLLRDAAAGGAEPLLRYDAFVSYSERDAGWVDNFLVPELEEPR